MLYHSRDNGSSVRAPHSAYENLDTKYANLINTKPIRSGAPLILVFLLFKNKVQRCIIT